MTLRRARITIGEGSVVWNLGGALFEIGKALRNELYAGGTRVEGNARRVGTGVDLCSLRVYLSQVF